MRPIGHETGWKWLRRGSAAYEDKKAASVISGSRPGATATHKRRTHVRIYILSK